MRTGAWDRESIFQVCGQIIPASRARARSSHEKQRMLSTKPSSKTVLRASGSHVICQLSRLSSGVVCTASPVVPTLTEGHASGEICVVFHSVGAASVLPILNVPIERAGAACDHKVAVI